MNRKIIHVDMDAFYASIEQRDNKTLMGRPIVIAMDPNHRGVVTTCSYEARKYGIHSAMPSQKAYSLCPQAIFIPPRMSYYREVSSQIMDIFRKFTDIIEPLSCDEAFLDVTENKLNMKSASTLAKIIKDKIYKELKLTASAGVSYNKFIAKLASDYKKPAGLTVIPPEKSQEFLLKMPVSKFFGVGKVTKERMHNLGIFIGADLIKKSEEDLISLFGKKGALLYRYARGEDNSEVKSSRKRKSIGKEHTYSDNIKDQEEILSELQKIAKSVEGIVKSYRTCAKTIKIKAKYDDFSVITKQKSYAYHINKYEDIYTGALDLIKEIDTKDKGIRLLGVTLSNFKEEEKDSYYQLTIDDFH